MDGNTTNTMGNSGDIIGCFTRKSPVSGGFSLIFYCHVLLPEGIDHGDTVYVTLVLNS